MEEETSEYSGAASDAIGRFGEMSMNAQIAEASDISGIVVCVTELPEPEVNLSNKIYQLIAVQPPYVIGRFYKCVSSEGSYSWIDVSEVREFDVVESNPEKEFFSLDGNDVRFRWLDETAITPQGERTFIKTEIQLVHLDTTGAVKSVRTIFTEAVKNAYPNGTVVTVDRYTADGIANGKITLRALSTYVGLVYIRNLRNVS